MSALTLLIIEINGRKKQIRINKNDTNLKQLKQKIINKFKKNVTFDEEFVIMTQSYNEEIEVDDDDDIEEFQDGTKLFIKFMTALKNNISKKSEENVINPDDNKEIFDEFDDLDDGEQEVQVNKTDLRQKASGCSIKDKDILKCIGKIRSTYIGSDGNPQSSVGSGTVYKVIDSYAYVITCAHNLRLNEHFECNKCNQRNRRRKCPNCLTLDSTANVLKAGKVYFERRKLENGDVEHTYKFESDVVYIEDTEYAKLPLPKCGYDICILKFKDVDNYYASFCKNVLLVDAKLFHTIRDKNDPYYIYGYPYKARDIRREEMWGAESINDMFDYEVNEYNNGQSFLKQREIDASFGTSGACIFSIYKQYFLIFAVHTGGSPKNHYNVGTLLDNKIDYLQIQTVASSQIKSKKDLIDETYRKIKMQKTFYSLIEHKFNYRRAQCEVFGAMNDQIYNIGLVWSMFRGYKRFSNKKRSTGIIVGHSSKYVYVLTAATALLNNNVSVERMSFQLLQNTSDGLSVCDRVCEYPAVTWRQHQSKALAVIKIADSNNNLKKIKPLKLRAKKGKNKYKKGVVMGYSSAYGSQLFGMKGDIECNDNKNEIKYKTIAWSGDGSPIFGFDIDEKTMEMKESINDNERLLLIKKSLSEGLHINAILNAMKCTNSLKYDVIYAKCGGTQYVTSKKDQEIYNNTDNVYKDIFGSKQLNKEMIGVSVGTCGVLLNDALLKWIKDTISTL